MRRSPATFGLYTCLLITCLFAVPDCVSYDAAVEEICQQACEQRKRCEPELFAQLFPMSGQCPLACENDWLVARRDETPECETAWKREFLCVAKLSCADLQIWREALPDQFDAYPCQAQEQAADTACGYECVDGQACHGWESCVGGVCTAIACESADDCPEGVWCYAGACSPI
jgi:hypothetical protein